MSKNKTYRKFAVTTVAAAAAVASVAPVVASADSATTFPDVNDKTVPTKSTQAAIYQLVSQGVVSGYADGTFKPGNDITRGQISEMLTKALELEIPGDVDKVNDVYADADKFYDKAKYIAATTNAGVFSGQLDGKFNAWSPINRGQMASVLGRALKEYDTGDDVDVNLDNVWEDAKEGVQILANLGVTKELNDFRPTENVTRAQFAAFTVRTLEVINEKEEEAKDPVVESVSAINAKQVKVEFSQPIGVNGTDENSYLVVNDATGDENIVDSVSKVDEKTVILNLRDAYRVSTDIAVTVDGVYLAGSIKDKFPKFSTVVNVHDTVAPEIASVTANTTSTNAAEEVIVTFTEPIQLGATFRINNKTVNATQIGVTTYKISGQDLAVDKSHELEVLNVKDYADHEVASLTKTFSVTKDNEAAKGQVTPVSDNKILVKFDKPVVGSSLDNVKFFTFSDADGGFTTALTPDSVEMADKVGKEWLFTLPVSYGTNKTSEEVLVKANKGVVDTSGNLTTPFETKVTLTQDVTGPALDNVTVDKNSKGEVTKLYFAYNEQLAANASGLLTKIGGPNVDEADADSYFSLVNNENNQDVDFTDVFGTPTSIELASDGKTVIVEIDAATNVVTSGSYKVTSEKGFVTDTAATPNDSAEVTKELKIGDAVKEVKATPSVDPSTNDFTVDFDQEVTAATAKNPANYKFDGKALPADTKIVVEDAKQVTFTLPDGFVKEDTDKAKIEISNIKPVNSDYTFKKYVGTIDVLDNTAPEATGKLLNTGEIFLTFSEDVASLTAADFDTVEINGLELNAAAFTATEATTEGATADNAVKITVNASVVEDVDGFSYLYIDVDNTSDLDFDKDIVLAKVSGDTAPDAWYTDAPTNSTLKPADLNKVDSVNVVTADSTTTTDDSTLNNKLEAGATIVIK